MGPPARGSSPTSLYDTTFQGFAVVLNSLVSIKRLKIHIFCFSQAHCPICLNFYILHSIFCACCRLRSDILCISWSSRIPHHLSRFFVARGWRRGTEVNVYIYEDFCSSMPLFAYSKLNSVEFLMANFFFTTYTKNHQILIFYKQNPFFCSFFLFLCIEEHTGSGTQTNCMHIYSRYK